MMENIVVFIISIILALLFFLFRAFKNQEKKNNFHNKIIGKYESIKNLGAYLSDENYIESYINQSKLVNENRENLSVIKSDLTFVRILNYRDSKFLVDVGVIDARRYEQAMQNYNLAYQLYQSNKIAFYNNVKGNTTADYVTAALTVPKEPTVPNVREYANYHSEKIEVQNIEICDWEPILNDIKDKILYNFLQNKIDEIYSSYSKIFGIFFAKLNKIDVAEQLIKLNSDLTIFLNDISKEPSHKLEENDFYIDFEEIVKSNIFNLANNIANNRYKIFSNLREIEYNQLQHVEFFELPIVFILHKPKKKILAALDHLTSIIIPTDTDELSQFARLENLNKDLKRLSR